MATKTELARAVLEASAARRDAEQVLANCRPEDVPSKLKLVKAAFKEETAAFDRLSRYVAAEERKHYGVKSGH